MGERINHLRIALHLSQEAFGAKIGIRGASVSLIESGKRNVSNQVITAVCREFNVNKIWLTTGNGDMFENVERTEEAGNINERIKHLRISLHLSQETFAERIDLKGSAISHLENGRRGITRQNINSICREFGVNEDWLRTGSGDMFENVEEVNRVENAVNLNERLKELRATLGISQVALARRVGVTRAAISRLESGSNGFTNQMIKSICREFGVNKEWFITGNGDMFVFSGSEDIKESLIEYINSTDDTFTLNLFAAIAKRTQTERDILKLLLKDLLSFM